MDPLMERVIEDGSWLVLLTAAIALFWFHHWGKWQASRSNGNEEVVKAQDNGKAGPASKKAA